MSATRKALSWLACLSFATVADVVAAENWSVSVESGGRMVGTSAVALDWGAGPVLVTVTSAGGDLSQPVIKLGERQVPSRLAGFDEISRLCFFRPDEGEGVSAPSWAGRAPSERGMMLVARSGSVRTIGKTEGWVNTIGGKVLPLALVKVGFGENAPLPGTPLLDEEERVAALVFQKSEDGQAVYAIPAEAVHRVAKDVASNGRLSKGWLGVSLRVENERPKIVRVFPGSPAAEAGMREEDLITRISNRPVASYADVANAFFYVIPGRTVDVEVRRGENMLAFTLIPVSEHPAR